MNNNSLLHLNPVQFFALECDCLHVKNPDKDLDFKTHALPSTHELTQDETFAKVALGWNEEGIVCEVKLFIPFQRSKYPNLESGDSIELFFDTRDLKTAGFNTRFCHHFFFLAHAVEGITKGELTHFRTEDRHELCDPEQLSFKITKNKKETLAKIFIPAQCLYGYDPKQFDRLGFTFRINRVHGHPQHFSVVTQNYQIEQQPSLWGSLKMI